MFSWGTLLVRVSISRGRTPWTRSCASDLEPDMDLRRGCKLSAVARPPVTDYRRIVDFVRSRGSVHYAKTAVPGEFAAWRRKIREAARAGDLSVSVIRTNDFVVIESRDYQVSADEDLATADVIDAALAGKALSFVDALHARRRERLRVARSPTDMRSMPPQATGVN
jgi:hypothetical protein